MQEYKRERSRLEVRLQEVIQKSADHDDHIRWVDAWVLQVCWTLQDMAGLLLTRLSSYKKSS